MEKLIFANIEHSKKEECQELYRVIDKLNTFANKMNYNLLVYLFEKQIGEHLIKNFIFDHKRNFLGWYNSLCLDYKSIIVTNILHNEELYSHC